MTIKQKQHLLGYLGYYEGIVDGIWGQQSQLATEAFQRDYQLTVDGVFGDGTAERIIQVISTGEEPVQQETETDTAGTYWDHIRYWTREEFRCRCHEYYPTPYCNGFPAEPDQTLVELVDDIRHKAGAPGIRSSGLRCPWHNRNSGGAATSKHLTGKALDFCIQGMPGARLLALAQADSRTSYAYQIKDKNGNLTDFVHVDVE